MKKNEEIIVFGKKIYQKKAIDETVKKFRHLAEFSTRTKGGQIIVRLVPRETSSAQLLVDEFSNYVLAETKSLI